MANLKGLYGRHLACARKTREDPLACAACFAQNFGDRLAERRCWYCSTDAFHSRWWGGWREVEGHLACGQCADRVRRGEQRFVRSVSTYRGRKWDPTRGRAYDTYYSLKHLKDQFGELSPILVVPLGNVLSESVRRLLHEEQLGRDVLLAPAPPSKSERQHARALTEQAAMSLDGVSLGLDVLQGHGVGESKELNLAGRDAQELPEVVGKVADRVVIVTDDFYTSGKTLLHSAEALLDAGAERVYGATVARVVNAPEAEEVFDGSEFLGGESTKIEWSEMRDGMRLVVEQATATVRLRFGCSACPEVLTTDHLTVGTDVPSIGVTCDTCGAEHELLVAWKNGRSLSATLKDRRSSEIIVSEHGN